MDKRYLLMFLIGLCATGSGPAEGHSPGQSGLSDHDPAHSHTQPAEVLTDPAKDR